jgi:energy-converting hydrogenase Eha subunit A
LSYIGYAVQTQITKGKFNLFACSFVVAVIIVLIIGLCGKPYQEPKENSITPFLNMPTDVDQAMLAGEPITVAVYCSYSAVGIAVIALTSILGVGSAALITTDAYKTIKAK